MPNWERIQQLRDHLATLTPKQVRMDRVLDINRDEESVAEASRPECGTVGCIAGHAYCLFEDRALMLFRAEFEGLSNCLPYGAMSHGEIVSRAGELLELSRGHPDDDEACDMDYVFLAGWANWAWDSGMISKDEVIRYLDKAINEKYLRVEL